MRTILPLLALAAALVVASPAQAIFLVTPLRLAVDDASPDVGDPLTFVVEPNNESEAARWAGRDVLARFGYDASEKPANGTAPADETTTNAAWTERDLAPVQLDGAARATFSWTVSEEARDHNVVVTLVADGETVGTVHVAVGNAPPQMMTMAGEGTESGLIDERASTADETGATPAAKETPGLGLVAVLGIGGVAAAVGTLVRRRRS